MTDLSTYYDQSYPPSVWTPPQPPATGATAGTPGTWTPGGSKPPANVADLIAGVPNPVTASPATLWTVGQYVQTSTVGTGGRASWNGTAWVAGAAPVGVQGTSSPADSPSSPQEAPEASQGTGTPQEAPEAPQGTTGPAGTG